MTSEVGGLRIKLLLVERLGFEAFVVDMELFHLFRSDI
jgi:hypothetical protein